MVPALFYQTKPEGAIQCLLCPHNCLLAAGQTGFCGVRQNIDGRLFSLFGDRIAALHNDPIEKKPLYHFLPGSRSLSLAAPGCNLKCIFCQNYSLSFINNSKTIYTESFTAEEIVQLALQAGAKSVSYTYSEPTVFIELFLKIAPLAKKAGLKNVIVSNGFINPEPLEKIIPLLDAANIDLKAFSESFYQKNCSGHLPPVLQTISTLFKNNIWTEVTTLLIPPLNSDESEIEQLIAFLLNLSPDIVWHISRFFPQYKLTSLPPTDPQLIKKTRQKAKEMGLHYVYGGNVSDEELNNTFCPQCSALLVQRSGYETAIRQLAGDRCSKCRKKISGIWN